MLIRVEVTPNPAARRFLLPRLLPLEAPIAFDRSSERRPRFVDRLLKIQGVTEVLFAREFISVSRDATAEPWPDLQFAIAAKITEALAEGEHAELDRWTEEQFNWDDPIEQQIAELLRTRIAPRVARDGGSINLLNYCGGVATVEMRGACGGCPSALMTLKRGVETTLKHYIPELQRVEASLEADPKKPFWKSMLEARGARFRNG
ncbi:MAG TPA: NifU family protein [Sphingomicrobium sp.]|jgi:Fe-S cluster biogenesis protein NfuA|nr:NifU family protein [Sphingomicrobium sp.]